jgi:hypothetical protein
VPIAKIPIKKSYVPLKTERPPLSHRIDNNNAYWSRNSAQNKQPSSRISSKYLIEQVTTEDEKCVVDMVPMPRPPLSILPLKDIDANI